VVVTTTTVDATGSGPPAASNDDQHPAVTGGGLGSSGLGFASSSGLSFAVIVVLAVVIVVVFACIVLILFSSQLKRGPRPRARAAAWLEDEDVEEDSSALVDLGGRPLRGPLFVFCFSATSTLRQ